MPEIVQHQLRDHLRKAAGASPPAVTLIHGQQDLVDRCLERLIDHLRNDTPRDLCCEGVDGVPENIPDVLERMSTYAMLAGPTIVILKDAKLFEPAGEKGDGHLQSLVSAIEKGFPAEHYLLVAVNGKVPKNRKFFKTMQARGLIVDCHVPLGERRADKIAQEAVLKGILDETLQKAGKRIAPGLFGQLQQLTGFDPVTFRGNIEKLIDYTGKRHEINARDVNDVLRRTKSDPLFELTSAVGDRDVTAALFYADALVGANWHPLQIVAALANQVRRLLVAKEFAASEEGRAWRPGMAYPPFQNNVMPAVQAYDARVARQVRERQQGFSDPEGEGKKKGDKSAADLALATNPVNTYPVFQTLSRSEKFMRSELIAALECLNAADIRLKRAGNNASLVLRTAIMTICDAKSSRRGQHGSRPR